MILSLTMNPALDISGDVNELIPNEKSYVFNERLSPGGNAINAARIAHRLGSQVLCTGPIGGSTGDEIKEMLRCEGIPCGFVPIGFRTRMNLTVSLKGTHQQTRLSFPGPKISTAEKNALKLKLGRARGVKVFMAGGSLPPGMGPGDVAQMVRSFNQARVLTIVDVPGEVLSRVISANPSFIKPNLTEFQAMIGSKVESIEEVLRSADQFSNAVQIQCISSVEGGALLVIGKNAWFGRIPKVTIHSTVGAGDSMVGAIAHWWPKLQGCDPRLLGSDLLQWGLAASTATLTSPGLNLGDAREIRKYFKQIKVTRVR